MKLSHAYNDVIADVDDTATMGIENNAHMFSILSDKLYTRKPEAIIREICCNALDAGGDPFLISINDELSIRDFGPGMSHEFMMGGYTRVGHSTKTGNEIGGFGIGRMAIFSYANEYSVTSIVNNTKRIYIIYRAANGLPAVSLVDTSITDEPSGVEVKVPITNRTDFLEAAKYVLRWFPEGSFKTFGFEVLPAKAILQTDQFLVVPNLLYGVIKIGPVTYRHDMNLPVSVVPIFEVNEMQPAPNRESISLDAKTKAFLEERIESIRAAIPALVIGSAASLSPIDKLKLVEQFVNYRTGMQDLFRDFHRRNEGEWGRILLREDERILIPCATAHYGRSYRGNGLSKQPTYRDRLEIRNSTDLAQKFVWNDLSEERAPRIYGRLNHNISVATVVHPSAEVPDLARLQYLLPDADIKLLSELTPPPPEQRYHSEPNIYNTVWGDHAYYWAETTTTPMLYVPFHNGKPEAGQWDQMLKLSMIKPMVVHGLSKFHQRRFPRAIRLDYYIKANLPAAEAINFSARQVWLAASRSHPQLLKYLVDYRPSKFAKVIAILDELQALKPSDDFNKLIGLDFIKQPKVKDQWRLAKHLDRIAARNPLLMAILQRDFNPALMEGHLK